MIATPFCKINLGLRVLRRRPDGYHDLESIFIPVPFLYDDLEITPAPGSDVQLTLSGIAFPGNADDNLCLRAYHLLKADFPDLPAVHIKLHKRIPFGAGLGGGSSDAAFTLKGLNDLFTLGLTVPRLEAYAARIGADCPFFIRCEPALVEGIGDRLTPLGYNPIEGYHLLLAKPPEAVNTREAYAGIDAIKAQEPIESIEKKEPIPSISSISSINSIKSTLNVSQSESRGNLFTMPSQRNVNEVNSQFSILNSQFSILNSQPGNDFEASVFPRHPAIAQLKADLYALGACYASMSGSGSVVYGLFEDAATLRTAAQRLRQDHPDYFISLDMD